MRVKFNVARGVGKEKVVLAQDVVHELDFSNCSEEELEELASKPVVIKLQALYRELKPEEIKAEDGSKVDVHELINRPTQRGPVDPAKAVLSKADKGELSEDDLRGLIAALEAKLTK